MSAKRARAAGWAGGALAAALAFSSFSPPALADEPAPELAATATVSAPKAPPLSPGTKAPRAPMPSTLEYDEGAPVPPGYRVSSRMREGIMIAGGVMFWASYVTSAIIPSAVNSSRCIEDGTVRCYYDGRAYYVLDIPFAGPFIAIGALHTEPAPTAGLIALGALQVAGGTLFLTGLVAQKKVLVRQAGTSPLLAGASVTPLAGPRSAGLSVRGAF